MKIKRIVDKLSIDYETSDGTLSNRTTKGPASVWFDGDVFWEKYGKDHRNKGPAIIYASGRQIWRKNGVHLKSKGLKNDEE